jgi:hypothetical protein
VPANSRADNSAEQERRRARLIKRLEAYHVLLRQYAPTLAPISISPSTPERTALCLPSTPEFRGQLPEGVIPWEVECRIGNGHDILEKIRVALGLKPFVTKRQRSERGYAAATRAHAANRLTEQKVALLAKVYRSNWEALQSLPVINWTCLQALEPEDLQIRSSWFETQWIGPESELPWIWTMARVGNVTSTQSLDMADRLREWELEGKQFATIEIPLNCTYILYLTETRLEWVHSRSNLRNFTEEITICKEEARRIPLSFLHEQKQWEIFANRERTQLLPRYAKGLQAFAKTQVEVYKVLAKHAQNEYDRITGALFGR